VKDENGDLLADSHNILNSWRICFSQLLNVDGISDVRQIPNHTPDSLFPQPCLFEVKIATENLKKYKSPGNDPIPKELIQAGGEILECELHELIYVWRKEDLPEQWEESIVVPEGR
jgi:hypothetical protein